MKVYRIFMFLLITLFIGMGNMFFQDVAEAAPTLVPNVTNTLFFRNVEVIYRSTANCGPGECFAFDAANDPAGWRRVIPVNTLGPSTGSVPRVGDVIVGIFNVQDIEAPFGVPVWAMNIAGDQLSGYFAQRVAAIKPNDPSPGIEHITLDSTVDPWGKLPAGTMFAVYVDDSVGFSAYETNGSISDDIAKATNGTLWATLSEIPGYAYGHVDLDLALQNFSDQKAFVALNTVINNTGFAYLKTNDVNETEIGGTPPTPPFLLNDIIGSSELEVNPAFLTGGSPWPYRSNDPLELIPIPFECSIDLKKQVREIKDPAPAWADADQCTDADVPVINVLGGAEYRLIVQNTGSSILTNCTITDSTLGINYTVLADLAPGETKTFTGEQIPELVKPNRCEAAGTLPNTASIVCDCADVAGETATDEDNACVKCVELGGCRMTGGHVKFYDDGTSLTVPGDAETYKVTQVTVKRGNKLQTQDQVTWYTLGGQIGAPQAACLSTPDTAFGNWEHVHHQGTVSWPAGSQQNPDFSWPAGSFSGGFAFHSGTASAPDEAFIKCITCADPGWCVQARCAPFKQIFWEGTGVFHNIDAGTIFPNSCEVKTPGKNKPGTIHYYRAHVGDFGEPAGSNQQQKPADQCGWASAGVSILDGILDGVTVLPWLEDLKFGDKGGQDCSSYPDCDKGTTDTSDDTCGECPDWYEIEIHCDASPNVCSLSRASCQTTNNCPAGQECQPSPIIYKVGNFITHGNHQIHPEVGQQCPF